MSEIEELDDKLTAGDDLENMTALDALRVVFRRHAKDGNMGAAMGALQRLVKYRNARELRDDLRGILPDAEIDRLLDAVRPVPVP